MLLTQTKKPLLIVPVENQVRELDAKLLLAAVAAERGFNVVIGSRFYIHFALPYLPRGIVIAKSMRSVSEFTLELTRGLGHEIVAWDEEGLVRFDSPEYFSWRYSTRAFATVGRLFAWGIDDAESFKRYEGYRGAPIHVTGNPRIDLLSPALRTVYKSTAASIKETYGQFILINTNFSFANNFVDKLNLVQAGDKPEDYSISRTGRGLSREFARGCAEHQQTLFDAFRRLIAALSRRFPDRKIVLRPHPSENHERWRRYVQSLDNVAVIHDGNVIPWLMACGVLLHNGCTTAVEAAVLGIPAVSFRPTTSPTFDYVLPNSLSHEAYSVEESLRLIDEVLYGRRQLVSQCRRDRLFARHLALGNPGLASDRVVDVLASAGYHSRAFSRPKLRPYLGAWFGMNGRTLLQRISMQLPGSRHALAHQHHRFPPIAADEMDRRITHMGAALNRFVDIRASAISPSIFSIRATG